MSGIDVSLENTLLEDNYGHKAYLAREGDTYYTLFHITPGCDSEIVASFGDALREILKGAGLAADTEYTPSVTHLEGKKYVCVKLVDIEPGPIEENTLH